MTSNKPAKNEECLQNLKTHKPAIWTPGSLPQDEDAPPQTARIVGFYNRTSTEVIITLLGFHSL